jgi:integration host factor subunit alpha
LIQHRFFGSSRAYGLITSSGNEDVLISGFGKFCVKEKSERKGRNPATGDEMLLRPRKVVTFRCSGKLRDKINGS